jgi:hypothetical protein
MSGEDTNPGGGYSAAYVQDLRNENASWRTKLRAAEETVEKQQAQITAAEQKATDLEGQQQKFLEGICKVLELDVTKTKVEELADKVKEATSKSSLSSEKAQEALMKSSFITAAVKAGVRKEALEDAYKIADFKDVKVDFEKMSVFQVDKDGKQLVDDAKNPISGLDSLVTGMVKDKPWLLGKNPGVGSPSNPGAGDHDTGDADGIGAQLGKQYKQSVKTQVNSQSHYFG